MKMDQYKEDVPDNEILAFIKKDGIFNKDLQDNASNKKTKISCRKHMVRVVLDLHGMKSEDAIRKIKLFFAESKKRGFKEILIIHGRGLHSKPGEGPVLKTVVKSMLDQELGHLVRDFRTALARDGGEGATLVYLA